ncbi:MAG: aspartate aminotransferase family protein [Bacteroidales bacterium]|nr:aspartate aminotransferase family protein [Bacteroidales bacterium]
MINLDEFKQYGYQLIDWITDYYSHIEDFPVKPDITPGSIGQQIPPTAPEQSETIDQILSDFNRIILPGMTHWQSPNFFAYFPANASFPSLLAEFLTAALAAQCMNWDTSPAATELEEKMMQWLQQATGIPMEWRGVIHDGASMATLTALLTAREKALNWQINRTGYTSPNRFRIYCSEEAHSSIEKSAKIAGFGQDNVIKIAVDEQLALIPEALEKQIIKDTRAGFQPLCVVLAIGTTGTTAIDPLEPVAQICQHHGIWLHIDAAYAGTALLLPEFRWMIKGIENADSFVFNPHKWMFTHFDCTAYFVKDPRALLKTFEILPEYLKSGPLGQVSNFRDWGIPMGRRFRALKLWFVLRNFGLESLRERIRNHIRLAAEFESVVLDHPDFELMTPRTLNVVCFRYHPDKINDNKNLDRMNKLLEEQLNRSGKLFLTHTRIREAYTLRMVIAQTNVTRDHVTHAWETIQHQAKTIKE